MNIQSIVLLAGIIVLMVLAFKKSRKEKRFFSCGGDCDHCGNGKCKEKSVDK